MAKPRVFVSTRNSQQRPATQIKGSGHTDRDGSAAFPLNSFLSSISLLGLCALMIVAATSSGCCWGNGKGGFASGYIDRFMQQQVQCMRDRVWARRAFHLRFGHCERVHADHFRDGFLCGYGDICQGGDGSVPALPPEKYYGIQYRSHEGLEMQNAWFEGYELGSSAAKQDGLVTYNEIQVSKEVTMAMEQARHMKDLASGVDKAYIVDMAPVTPAPAEPDATQRESAMGSGRLVPSFPAGANSNQLMPIHVVPADVPLDSRNNSQR